MFCCCDLQIPSMPPSEIRSSDFQMKANGHPVPVWHCRVSAVPMNLGWPGHQRCLEQTEPASFAFFDFSAPVTVEIRVLSKRIEKVEIRPAIYGIQPLVEGDLIRFTLDKPRHFTLEINGFHNALHIFSSHIKKYEIPQEDPNVIYFSPGVHQAGAIHLSSGQTVYLAPGAVVYGGIYAENAENIRVLGRGILDCSLFPRADGTAEECFGMPLSATICLKNCKNVTIDGVICRDSSMWTIVPNYCVNVSINDVKLIGLWRYNTDGIDICNSKQVRITNSFLRTFDDGIVVKGMKWCDRNNDGKADIQDLLVEGCVLWCDWGKALEVGVETFCDSIRDVTMRNCHIIRSCFTSIDVYCCHRALVENLLFEDITVQNDDHNPRFVFQQTEEEVFVDDPSDNFVPNLAVCQVAYWDYDHSGERGNVRNVTFRNISCFSRLHPATVIGGYDSAHTVEGVRFENILFNGKKAETLEQLNLQNLGFTKDVTLS